MIEILSGLGAGVSVGDFLGRVRRGEKCVWGVGEKQVLRFAQDDKRKRRFTGLSLRSG
jgi:hypothetical protein